jgi:hypothetical protein
MEPTIPAFRRAKTVTWRLDITFFFRWRCQNMCGVSLRIALAKFRNAHGPAEVQLQGVCAVIHLLLEQVLCIYRPSFRIHFCFWLLVTCCWSYICSDSFFLCDVLSRHEAIPLLHGVTFLPRFIAVIQSRSPLDFYNAQWVEGWWWGTAFLHNEYDRWCMPLNEMHISFFFSYFLIRITLPIGNTVNSIWCTGNWRFKRVEKD